MRHRLIVCGLEDHALALVNFEVKDATEPRDFIEGCLSLPGVQVNVRRPERIRVTGYDLHGQRRSYGATGLWARVIQHELDHLNGVLICDYRHPEAGTHFVASIPVDPDLRQAWLENACLHSAEGEAEADKIVRALEQRHGCFPDRHLEPAAERTPVR